MSRLGEYGLFWREFRRTFRTTGAIAPSGRGLGRRLARFVSEPADRPRRILEVGPGTGSVTRHIAQAMRPEDQLDLVELNDAFVRQLGSLFESDPVLRPVADRTTITRAAVEDFPPGPGYDLIISGLPLNNFEVDEVDRILAALARIGAGESAAAERPGRTTVLSFFEYIAIRRVRGLVGRRRDRARLRGIGQTLDRHLAGRELRREAVWMNIPPAWVHHVRLGPATQ